jgi:flagellar hook-basal body complex protein FliE
MPSPIAAAGAYAATQSLAQPVSKPATGGSFADVLGHALQSVADSGRQADAQTSKAMQGKADMIDVVTAVAESETALETLVAVRDRVIAAYEEIMRMPV